MRSLKQQTQDELTGVWACVQGIRGLETGRGAYLLAEMQRRPYLAAYIGLATFGGAVTGRRLGHRLRAWLCYGPQPEINELIELAAGILRGNPFPGFPQPVVVRRVLRRYLHLRRLARQDAQSYEEA